MLPLLSLSLPLLSRPLSDLSRPSGAAANALLGCLDWNEGGSSSGGTVGGKDWPCFATSTKCMARANSSMLSWPSLSKSERFLQLKKCSKANKNVVSVS